jgi:hypothetical protein
LKTIEILSICLLAIALVPGLPGVHATQTTSIHKLFFPATAVAGSQDPIPVTTTVYYNNTAPGYRLVVGVLNAITSPQTIVAGIVVSSTDPCLNQGEVGAVCAIKVPAVSGVEQIGFQIGGIFGGQRGPGSWVLNITSAIFDGQGNLISASVSSTLFTIELTPVTLSVIVPESVAVSVNGVQQSPGPVEVGVALGENNITVPTLAQVNSFTRLRFDHWSDGSVETIHTVVVTGNESVEAVYVSQNLLTIAGPDENATGAGWYDANSIATFSANQYQPQTGLLGALGARLTFQGWYENGQLITNSPNGTISMDKPHTLTAVWQTDFTVPGGILLGIVAAIVIAYLVVRRRKTKPTRRRRPRTRRRRSSRPRT